MSTPFFMPGQAVYYLSIGGTRSDLTRLLFGVISHYTYAGGSWDTLRSYGRVTIRIQGAKSLSVAPGSIAHAGWCPICEEPAHVRDLGDGTVLPRCPHCQLQALPTPPPEAYSLARFSRRGSSWMRFTQRLAVQEQLELTWAEFQRARRAFDHEEHLAEVGEARAA